MNKFWRIGGKSKFPLQMNEFNIEIIINNTCGRFYMDEGYKISELKFFSNSIYKMYRT